MILIELGIPLLFMIALFGLKQLINPVTIDLSIPSSPTSAVASFQQQYVNPPCAAQNLLWRCVQKNNAINKPGRNCTMGRGCQAMKIAVAPSGSGTVQIAQDFATYASTVTAGLGNQVVSLFESESAFNNYVSNPGYSLDPTITLYSSAIIFNSGPPTWDFTIRLNGSYAATSIRARGNTGSIPRTDSTALDETILYNSAQPGNNSFDTYINEYAQIGYFSLSDFVNSFISTRSCQLAGKCSSSDRVQVQTKGVVPFPSDSIEVSGFWGLIGFIFGLFIILGLLTPVAMSIMTLVSEKESKIREGMCMMSLRNDVLWLSWWLHNFFLYFPMAIILTLAGGSIFVYSDKTYVFAWFFLFFMASISYAFFISTIFNSSKAAAIVGVLFYFAGFFIYLGLLSGTPSASAYLVASLHPSAAFIFGTLAFIEYEDNHIGVTRFTAGHSNKYPITFSDTLGFLVLDSIYLLVLSWYLANVLPAQYGTPKPWYFFLQPTYWFPARVSARTANVEASAQSDDECPVEPVTDNYAAQITNNQCVDIHGLKKVFMTNTGPKVAVDGLNLTMFSGQITALLGHNGAGKSTAIAMLTGLIPSDDGIATVEGLDMAQNMGAIRSIIGVCPQHDILFPYLTVQEHLSMFAAFKGCPSNRIKEEVEKMIQSVGLTEKRNVYSKFLSGGQKRKLSVGIAFIGDSRVVFLDEPTSGMDPYSRRFTWNVIRQHREGRVIVLTTHFMDEADLLGDRIAIMADGKLRCCGSSLFLKQKFGVGYNMTLEKQDALKFNSSQLSELVHSSIPTAKLLTDVGTEISYQLPFNSSDKFQSLFETFDGQMEGLGLRSYGISVTTLEEVFLKIAEGTHTITTATRGKYNQIAMEDDPVDAKGADVTPAASGAPVRQAWPSNGSSNAAAAGGDPEAQARGAVPFDKIGDDNVFAMFLQHMVAMLKKRFLYFRRDIKAWCFQLFVPIFFVIIGVIVQVVTSSIDSQPEIILSTSVYNKGISSNNLPLPYSNRSFATDYVASNGLNAVPTAVPVYNQQAFLQYASGSKNFPLLAVNYVNKRAPNATTKASSVQQFGDVSQFLYDNKKKYQATMYGAYYFTALSQGSLGGLTQLSYYLYTNYTAVHGGPVFSSLLADTLVKSYDPSYSVKTRLHPLSLTNQETQETKQTSTFLLIAFILIAMAITPAAFATFVVREREVKAKYQQMVSGVTVWAYWTSTWIWDQFTFQLTMWSIILIIGCTPGTEVIGNPNNNAMGVTIGLFFLFGFSVTSFTYLVSFPFKFASTAQIAIIFIVLLIGLGLSIVGTFLRLISTTTNVYKSSLRYIFMLLPPFAFGEGLFSMTYATTFATVEMGFGQTYALTDMKLAGANLVYLFWTGLVYFLLTVLVDYSLSMPSFQAIFSSGTRIPIDNTLRDEDVLAEEKRVADGETLSDTIVIKDVKKVFSGGKFAVRGVSLGIPNGECFGLLGINGAGKSTTLSMLTGEIPPTSGALSLNGMNLLTEIHKCRRYIGYCPQFDALFELLTGREHLSLYAAIKGILPKDINAVVSGKIAEMGLTEYADRSAATYSGGNKRKLSVAMAMIGEPSIVFLDEPSTGMDPMARRFMWDVISDIVTKREKCSLILTTHSMEECEALCTRIGIMVGGVLRCLGSGQRLRSRYGLGFQVELVLRLTEGPEVEDKMALISRFASPQTAAGNPVHSDPRFTPQQIRPIFTGIGKEQWIERLSHEGSGSEIHSDMEAQGYVLGKLLASWMILEEAYDGLSQFLTANFPGYIMRERQTSRIRLEIPSITQTGEQLRLSVIFGKLESNKGLLRLQDYSVGQTSLEQIFNQFASQQEEETGVVIR